MEKLAEISKWLSKLPRRAEVGVDEGGLCLRAVVDGELTGEYYEVGGISEEIENCRNTDEPPRDSGTSSNAPSDQLMLSLEGENLGLRDWDVHWSKTYHATGTEHVKAATREEARKRIRERIGDLEGSLQYDPDRDTVEAVLVDNPLKDNAKKED